MVGEKQVKLHGENRKSCADNLRLSLDFNVMGLTKAFSLFTVVRFSHTLIKILTKNTCQAALAFDIK